jgi:hypothetical protein
MWFRPAPETVQFLGQWGMIRDEKEKIANVTSFHSVASHAAEGYGLASRPRSDCNCHSLPHSGNAHPLQARSFWSTLSDGRSRSAAHDGPRHAQRQQGDRHLKMYHSAKVTLRAHVTFFSIFLQRLSSIFLARYSQSRDVNRRPTSQGCALPGHLRGFPQNARWASPLLSLGVGSSMN